MAFVKICQKEKANLLRISIDFFEKKYIIIIGLFLYYHYDNY